LVTGCRYGTRAVSDISVVGSSPPFPCAAGFSRLVLLPSCFPEASPVLLGFFVRRDYGSGWVGAYRILGYLSVMGAGGE